MIYRIQIDSKDHPQLWVAQRGLMDGGAGTGRRRLSGPSYGDLADLMWRLGLKSPRLNNRRCRFYFTERGWERVGKFVASEARRIGHLVKVIREKNPRSSQVVYFDELQVALLAERR